jgi:hypothetical protein
LGGGRELTTPSMSQIMRCTRVANQSENNK